MSRLAFDPFAAAPPPTVPVRETDNADAMAESRKSDSEKDAFNRLLKSDAPAQDAPAEPAAPAKEPAESPAAALPVAPQLVEETAAAVAEPVTTDQPDVALPVTAPVAADEADMPLPQIVLPQGKAAPSDAAAALAAAKAAAVAAAEAKVTEGQDGAAPAVTGEADADAEAADVVRVQATQSAGQGAGRPPVVMAQVAAGMAAVTQTAAAAKPAAPTAAGLLAGVVAVEAVAEQADEALTLTPVVAVSGEAAAEYQQTAGGKAGQAAEPALNPADFASVPDFAAALPLNAADDVDVAAEITSSQNNSVETGAAMKTADLATSVQTAQAGAERPTMRLMPVLEQVRIGLARAADMGAPSKLSLELAPRNLGKVVIEIDVGADGQLRAGLQADNPAALEILRREAPQLERSLQEAGYKLDQQSLSFSLRDQQSGRDGGEGGGRRGTETAMPATLVEDEAPAARRSRSSLGRVDVMV